MLENLVQSPNNSLQLESQYYDIISDNFSTTQQLPSFRETSLSSFLGHDLVVSSPKSKTTLSDNNLFSLTQAVDNNINNNKATNNKINSPSEQDYLTGLSANNLLANEGIKINFQTDDTEVPLGYIADIGQAYNDNRGFGWVTQASIDQNNPIPINITANARERNEPGGNQKLETLIHMQYLTDSLRTDVVKTPAAWEYALPDGLYTVTVSVGDYLYYDSRHTINIEGNTVIEAFENSPEKNFHSASTEVLVDDGKLTVDAIGGFNTKINFIEIYPKNNTGIKPDIEIENLDQVPFSDRLVFNRIENINNPSSTDIHDEARLRIKNVGSSSLALSQLSVTGPWEIVNSNQLPDKIAPQAYVDLSVRFIATSKGDNNGVHKGELIISSNDPDESNVVVELAGFWQKFPEGNQEPSLEAILDVFGYTTQLVQPGQKLENRGLVQAVGEETLSSYWQQANPSKPINVRQLAAFHRQGEQSSIFWHYKDTETVKSIFTHDGLDGQSFLPRKKNEISTNDPAQGSFETELGSAFGFRVDGGLWSDSTLNKHNIDDLNGSPGPSGHRLRFWPVRDRNGKLVANTWLIGMDYSSTSESTNYDYNDNVYLVENIKPEQRNTLYRIDVGNNSSLIDSNGNLWSSDLGLFEPSGKAPALSSTLPIAHTKNDLLYQTFRGELNNSVSPDNRKFVFNLPLENIEKVDIRLHFAETKWNLPGQRIFDVKVEGDTVMNNFDIIEAVGNRASASLIEIRNIEIQDSLLNLEFLPEVDWPSIAGIEVLTSEEIE